jgi:hypothetical protein
MSVLSVCPIPKVIASMTENEFETIIEVQHNGRRLMRRKLRGLHQAAKTSIGIYAGAQSAASEIIFLAIIPCVQVLLGSVGQNSCLASYQMR